MLPQLSKQRPRAVTPLALGGHRQPDAEGQAGALSQTVRPEHAPPCASAAQRAVRKLSSHGM